MRRKYTVFGKFIKMALITITIILVLVYSFNVLQETIETPILFIIIYFILSLFWFRDYKIIIDNTGIKFYSLFQKNKFYEWKDIKKMEFTKENYGNSEFQVLIMHIYGEDDKHDFSLERFNKKILLNDLMNRCAWHHIEIHDLTESKESKS